MLKTIDDPKDLKELLFALLSTSGTLAGLSMTLVGIIDHFADAWGTPDVLLIGYSFGADIIPFMVNRIKPAVLEHVRLISLLGLSSTAEFEIRMSGWINGAPSADALPLAPELGKLDRLKVQCFVGADEQDESGCMDTSLTGAEIIKTAEGIILAGIDTRIVIVGLPTVARALGADVESIVWVSQSYLLASTVGLLLIGRITDVVGRVKIYNLGFAVFTVGSALASISTSASHLICSRIGQGLGAAMLLTNSAAILTDAAPAKQLGTILGINQIAFRAGSVAGLTLSGIIIGLYGWRALFYLNIPIGIFGTLWAHLRLREIATKDEQKNIDWIGFATFSSGLTLVLLAITTLSYGAAEALTGMAMLAAGVLLLLGFVWVEIRSRAPLLDLQLFRIREFAAGNIAQLFNALAWLGMMLIVSFYMQVVLDFTPMQTGMGLLPLEFAFVVAGPLSGMLSDKYGPQLFATLGLSISSIAFFWFAGVDISASYSKMAVPLILLGIGSGMFVSPNISSIMRAVPANRRGVASAFRTTMFNVGGTASTGLAILLITTAIPHSVFSDLLRSPNPGSLGQLPEQEFVKGFKVAAFVLAWINTLAIIPSLLRGQPTGSDGSRQKSPNFSNSWQASFFKGVEPPDSA